MNEHNTTQEPGARQVKIGESRREDSIHIRYVDALFGSIEEGLLIELRFRVGSGMRQRFFPTAALGDVCNAVLALATRTDVFIGVLPRVRPHGRLEDVAEPASVLWADCDTQGSVEVLSSFEPRPSMLVGSGSAENRHAYWLLRDPIDLHSIASLNRRLALALGADVGVVTTPQTVLRPAGSLNRKHSPPAAVRLLGAPEPRRVSAEELDHRLPLEQPPLQIAAGARAPGQSRRASAQDPLLSLAPRRYFEQLTGLPVGRSGKVRCPFHHGDRTPSLHVYDDPARGWYCFGCGRGGSVYDLASLLLRRETRGRDFIRLRNELQRLFR